MRPLLKDPERQKMYEHIVGMFIVTWLLLIALLVFSCKDKAEAENDESTLETVDSNSIFFWEPNYPQDISICAYNGGSVELRAGKDNEVICDSTREKFHNILYEMIYGKEPTEQVTLIFEEPPTIVLATSEVKLEVGGGDCGHKRLESINSYWAFTSTIQDKGILLHGEYRCLDCGCDIVITSAVLTKPDVPEPNEPQLLLLHAAAVIEPNEPEYYHPLDQRAYQCPKCYPGATGNLCPGHYEAEDRELIYTDSPLYDYEPEPNETSGTIHIWEPNKPQKVSLDFIPTWPDYIELEKDLVIEDWRPNEKTAMMDGLQINLGKGTKIYFKEATSESKPCELRLSEQGNVGINCRTHSKDIIED